MIDHLHKQKSQIRKNRKVVAVSKSNKAKHAISNILINYSFVIINSETRNYSYEFLNKIDPGFRINREIIFKHVHPST